MFSGLLLPSLQSPRPKIRVRVKVSHWNSFKKEERLGVKGLDTLLSKLVFLRILGRSRLYTTSTVPTTTSTMITWGSRKSR